MRYSRSLLSMRERKREGGTPLWNANYDKYRRSHGTNAVKIYVLSGITVKRLVYLRESVRSIVMSIVGIFRESL